MSAAAADLGTLIKSFFTRHLAAEYNASGHTIRSYRDTFRLFLRHVAAATGRTVARLSLQDLTPATILSFLDYLEQARSNSVATRNVRLAALRSFFSFVASQEPTAILLAQQVLAIPFKRGLSRVLGYLSAEELRAVLAGPDRTSVKGAVTILSSRFYTHRCAGPGTPRSSSVNFRLDRPPLVRITGKGRKQRIVPLLPIAARLVQIHLAESKCAPEATSPLFLNRRGDKLTRSGVSFLVEHYRRLASEHVPTLHRTGISPHTFRHTKAMHLLQAGVSPVTIKDFLGHAHLKTLEVYVEADLEMKRRALESAPSPVKAGSPARRHAEDILRWLEQLSP